MFLATTTNSGNAAVGLVILGVVLVIIVALAVLLSRASGQAGRLRMERDYLREENERLRQYMTMPVDRSVLVAPPWPPAGPAAWPPPYPPPSGPSLQ